MYEIVWEKSKMGTYFPRYTLTMASERVSGGRWEDVIAVWMVKNRRQVEGAGRKLLLVLISKEGL
jgi:hypothetical protein